MATERCAVAALVLAGGASRRMHADKRTLRLEGESFLNRSVASARSVADDVWLLVSSYGEYRQLAPELRYGVNVAVDRVPNAGPMSALAGVLPHLNAEAALLLAVDYPLLSPAFLQAMIERFCTQRPAVQVLVPQSAGRWHVTCAVYASSLNRSLVRRVDHGDKSLWRWVAAMPDDAVDVMDVADWPEGATRDELANVNTPADYRRVRRQQS